MINPKATNLFNLNLIPLDLTSTEPPLTRHMTGVQLLALKTAPLQVDLPVTSVVVERGVKDVTRGSTVCVDAEEQDGFNMQTISARKRNLVNDRNKTSWGK